MYSTDRNTLDSQKQTRSIFAQFHSIPTQTNSTFYSPSKTQAFNFQRTHLLLRGCDKLLQKEKDQDDLEFLINNRNKLRPRR